MILIDTSVWVDHLRVGNPTLVHFLEAGTVLTHPFIVGEIALGNLRQRVAVLSALSDLPGARVATDAEVLHFIDGCRLFGHGIGYVDAHVLAAVQLTPGAGLWTYDKHLHRAAQRLGMSLPATAG